MTRQDYEVVINDSNERYDMNAALAVKTIDSTAVTAGIRVTDAFRGKQNTLMLGFTNTSGGAKHVYIRKGGYDGIAGQAGFSTSNKDIDVLLPAGALQYLIRVGKIEASVKNQNASLCIDMQTGLTGTFFAYTEAGHIDAKS